MPTLVRTLLLYALLTLSPLAAQSPDFTPVTTRVQSLVTTARLPGAAVLIVRDGEPIYSQAFGSYTLEQRVPIASASKWLSAAVIARLVDRGVLRWDDRIERYLPTAPADKRAITLRQLFSHSSGLSGAAAICISIPAASLQSCVDSILATPLLYAPGRGFVYGGNSMQVAGRMAEIASGQRWDDLFRAEVAGPLGMTQTDYGFSSSAPGYLEVSNPRIAGGARSTLRDYGRLMQAMLERGSVNGTQWLSAALIEQMAEDQTRGAPVIETPLPNAPGYGIGQWIERVDAGGHASLLSSPGAFGFYPVIDHAAGFAGVFLVDSDLATVSSAVTAMWADVRTILTAQAPQLPRLIVANGSGGGLIAAGSAVDAFAQAPGEARIFARWRGDSPMLADPRAWHAPLTTSSRASTLTAEFFSIPGSLDTTTGNINGSRYRQLIPANPRGLVFSFHGSGGSGDLPFTKSEARVATRLLLSRGFGVIGLDSVNRVDRQWNPQFALSNPDVVNVQGIIEHLRTAGTIGASTPIHCEGTSNGGGFCSRISALLGFRAQSLMIADGIEPIMAQTPVPTIWTLGRFDPTLAPGYLERAAQSAAGMSARGIVNELNIVEASPVYPERFARIDGVSVADSTALVASLRSAGFLDASGRVIRDPRGNALDAIIPAALRSRSGEIVAQMELAAAAHEYYSDHAHRVVHFFEAQLAPNYSGLWWKADEPGWGLSLAHQGSSLFPTWYTFGPDGRSTWYVGGVLTPQPDGSYRGPAYRTTGRRFDQIGGNVGAVATEVGSFSVRPLGDGGLEFTTAIGNVQQMRRVERIRFGRQPACRFKEGSRSDSANRSDIWWNPNESGWGLYLTEQERTLVVTWYTYASDGQPMWLLGALTRDAQGAFAGDLTRPVSGTPFDRINGAATTFPVPTVGSARVEFVDGERAAFRYTLDGVSQSKDIERLVYAGPGLSDCQ
jgi:CubicO group peptidase (beta-lactamase class C family)